MHRVRWFHFYFKLFILQTHTEDSKESATAPAAVDRALCTVLALYQIQMKRPRPLPALLLLLCFTSIVKLNASGSSTTYVRFRSPNPEGGFESSHQFHAQAPRRVLSRLLVLLSAENITGSNPCWMGGKIPKEFEASTCGRFFVFFDWFCLQSATIRTQSDSADVFAFNQMLANILNPKPDGFPQLISL